MRASTQRGGMAHTIAAHSERHVVKQRRSHGVSCKGQPASVINRKDEPLNEEQATTEFFSPPHGHKVAAPSSSRAEPTLTGVDQLQDPCRGVHIALL